MRLPFDWKHPIGYLFAVAFQCMLILNPLRYIACILSLEFANYVFTSAMSKEMINDLRTLNESTKASQSQKQQQQQQQQQLNTFQLLTKFIRTHSNGKQFSKIV